jgi:hypothetical protein
LKTFNDIAFDKIDEKESEEILIQDFIKDPYKCIGGSSSKKNLEKEYELMKKDWAYYR